VTTSRHVHSPYTLNRLPDERFSTYTRTRTRPYHATSAFLVRHAGDVLRSTDLAHASKRSSEILSSDRRQQFSSRTLTRGVGRTRPPTSRTKRTSRHEKKNETNGHRRPDGRRFETFQTASRQDGVPLLVWKQRCFQMDFHGRTQSTPLVRVGGRGYNGVDGSAMTEERRLRRRGPKPRRCSNNNALRKPYRQKIKFRLINVYSSVSKSVELYFWTNGKQRDRRHAVCPRLVSYDRSEALRNVRRR